MAAIGVERRNDRKFLKTVYNETNENINDRKKKNQQKIRFLFIRSERKNLHFSTTESKM